MVHLHLPVFLRKSGDAHDHDTAVETQGCQSSNFAADMVRRAVEGGRRMGVSRGGSEEFASGSESAAVSAPASPHAVDGLGINNDGERHKIRSILEIAKKFHGSSISLWRSSSFEDASDALTTARATAGSTPSLLEQRVHARPECSTYLFDSRLPQDDEVNAKFCSDCLCYVCGTPASQCASWHSGNLFHCQAVGVGPKGSFWRSVRDQARRGKSESLGDCDDCGDCDDSGDCDERGHETEEETDMPEVTAYLSMLMLD